MSTITASPVITGGYHSFRRFSVDEYHRMIDAGILNELDQVELLEGFVVVKMPRNPIHDATIELIEEALSRVLPQGWRVRVQSAVTFSDSEPEPDLVLVRGSPRSRIAHNPGAADVGLIIEVADSSLTRDRVDKGQVYARAGIPCYWIVNLQDRIVEAYTVPVANPPTASYNQRLDNRPADKIALTLDGVVVCQVAVRDLLP
jgi:Uma2 family endonuclease